MSKKIGIPRSLLNYKYCRLWETFFQQLGLETVLSSPTNRHIVQAGIQYSIEETCLPVKIFFGHVVDLRDKADYIFVPRFVSVEKGNFVCCKFLGIPDVIRNSIPGLPPLISMDIDLNRRPLPQTLCRLGRRFTRNRALIKQACREAIKRQDAYAAAQQKVTWSEGLTIGLIAHSYNIYDTYSNLDIVKKINDLGAEVVTPAMLPTGLIRREGERFSPDLYWTYNKELVGAAVHLSRAKRVQGIILLTSFGCGPDSLLSELMVRRLKDTVPIMSLVFDEETAEAGFMTRLESFVEMIKRRL